MKKALIGTSALIAVGLLTAQGASAADGIKLGLSGNYNVLGGIVSQDDGTGEGAAGARDHGIGTDGKINFSGSTTLDNGIEVGVRVELEAQDTSISGNIDEDYIWIENTDVWGRLEFGNRDGAGNKMNVLAPYVFGSAIVGVQTIMLASAPGAAGASAFGSNNSAAIPIVVPGLSGDATKITYFTPRFSGIQLGVSYSPDGGTERGAAFGTASGALEKAGGTGLGEILEAGVNWNGNLGDASVRVSGAYADASSEEATGAQRNDRDEWAVAASASMNGWSFGAQYQNGETNGGQLTTTTQRDDIEWRAGLTYATGAWVLGLEYANRNVEVSATAEDEVEIWGLGAKRNLGAGVSAGIGVHMWDWDDGGNDATQENDATEFFFVTEISF